MELSKQTNQPRNSKPVDRLEEFCKSNLELWISRYKFLEKVTDKDKREKLQQQLEQAMKDYNYVVVRMSKGKLSNTNEEILKEAGVGRVFGYTKEIENIANKYSYDDLEFFKKFLYYACAKYGSLDNFRKHYVQSLTDNSFSKYDVGDLLDESKKNSDILDKYFITEFDISNPNFQSECPSGYYKLYRKISENQSRVFDREALDNATKGNEHLTDKEKEILSLRFDFENNGAFSLVKIGKKYNLSKSRIDQIESKAIRKVRAFLHIKAKRNNNLVNTWSQYSTLKKDVETALIKKYFEYHDIFSDHEPVELDENAKTALQDIINGKKLPNSDDTLLEKLSTDIEFEATIQNLKDAYTVLDERNKACETLKDEARLLLQEAKAEEEHQAENEK